MTFTVQDLPGVSAASLPPNLASRITFMDHDYFTPQPVQNADAYFFGMIFHNQTDKHVVQILRNLITALKPGARILWCDREVGDELSGKTTLMIGMLMKLLMNGRERALEEKMRLFVQADKRFVFGRTVVGRSSFTVVEAVWMG